MSHIIEGVIRNGAGSVLFGGKQLRGPLKTADFIYEVMIGVALELTERLPQMFEAEAQKHCQQKKFLYEHGHKGKYTDSYGWSRNHEFKHDFSLDPTFHFYFNRIIVPFLGGKKKAWNDENSRIWKWIKKLIISRDRDKIGKLQQNIRNRILKEARRRIQVAYGTDNSQSCESGIIKTGNL